MGEEVALNYNNGVATLSFELDSNPAYSYSVYNVSGDSRTEISPFWHEDGVGGEYYNPGAYNYLYIIELPESVPKNTTFDFNLLLYRRGAHSITGFYALDASGKRYDLNCDSATLTYMEWNTMAVNFSNFVCNDSSIAKIGIHFYYQNVSGVEEYFATNLLSADLVKVSEESLMGNIIQIIQNIWTGITELPQKIADFILDGLKSLFVPTEEDITEMQDKFTTLLSDRFGALYQVIDLVIDYANAFTASEKKTITFPTVSIPLGEANFDFGGWEIQIVPDGFDVLMNGLKMIISIACTVLFVNGMRSRFEKLVGGSDDI